MSKKVHVSHCSACGGEHNLIIREFKEPIYDSGERYTHYALCPKTGKALYIRYDSAREESDGGKLEK